MANAMPSGAIHAELGEIIAGLQPGRQTPEQVTVFGSVGLAFQDLAGGWLAYNTAREMQLGRRINLLS
jgi:ornithine cyclodeaminase/alanine dehydrogenase-like protein (mu-crystallin family)